MKYFIFISAIIVMHKVSYCQCVHNAEYKNILYLNKLTAQNYKGQLNQSCGEYIIKSIFQIDTTGQIINYTSINRIPLPSKVENFVKEMIFQTDKQWQSASKNCKKVISDTITIITFLNVKCKSNSNDLNSMSSEINPFSPTNYDTSKDNIYSANKYGLFIDISVTTTQ